MTSGMLKGCLVAAVAFASVAALPGFAQDKPTVGLITKTETCLLYTSPSPRDISGSRMPSAA